MKVNGLFTAHDCRLHVVERSGRQKIAQDHLQDAAVRKYSTSAGASILAVVLNCTRDPSSRVTETFVLCRGVIPALSPVMEKASKPLRPKDCAESCASNCKGRIPMQGRLLR